MPSSRLTRLAGASPALLALLLSGVAAAQEIGTAGAVNPAASGTPPARPTRVLELGARIIHKERISTTAGGTVQLVFLDKTTMSIGPNSDLVIDEFVYDPKAGTGRMAASLAKGVLRFVGGNTSHTGGATVKTPAATLGIRGGVATVSHDVQNGTKAINHFGILSVTTALGTEVIRRPGFAINIPTAAAAPPAPRKVTQAEVAETNSQLTSKPGQSGGASSRPTEQTAAANGVGSTNAQISPSIQSVQAQNAAQNAAQDTTVVEVQQVAQEVQQQANTQQQQQAATETVVERRQEEEQQQQRRPVERIRTPRAFALVQTGGHPNTQGVPYVLGSALASGSVHVTPIMAYRAGGDGNAGARSRTLQVAFGVNGSGPSQSSNFMVATGTYAPGESGGPGIVAGGFRHMARQSGGLGLRRASGSFTSVVDTLTVDSDQLPTGYRENSDDFNNNVRTPAQANARLGGGSGATPYTFDQPVARTTTPTGLGQNRPFGALVGFAGGMVQTIDLGTNTRIEDPQPLYGGSVLAADPSDSRVALYLGLQVQRTGTEPAGAFNDAQLQMGNLDPSQNPRGTYIDYNNFGAREAATNITADSQTSLSTVNGAPVERDWAMMASSGSANVQSFFSGVTWCQCEYTRWGLWSYENRQSGYSDRVHLGTFVAGQLPDAPEIPVTGSATYNGHVIASIRQSSSEYLAAGNLTNTLNFGTRVGAVSVSNLDGRNYSGTVNLATDGTQNFPSFGGNLTGTGGAAMSMNGFLYRGPTSPYGEMGGNVLINGGPGYSGSGIFAASKIP